MAVHRPLEVSRLCVLLVAFSTNLNLHGGWGPQVGEVTCLDGVKKYMQNTCLHAICSRKLGGTVILYNELRLYVSLNCFNVEHLLLNFSQSRLAVSLSDKT